MSPKMLTKLLQSFVVNGEKKGETCWRYHIKQTSGRRDLGGLVHVRIISISLYFVWQEFVDD